MYSYIKGIIEEINLDHIVIDNNGIGYKINASANTIMKVKIGHECKIYTKLIVKEDDMSLCGFYDKEELKMFELLISVSGVGAKTALTMLAICEPSEFALAVISEDIKTLTTIPGIGPKSAKRIILELKDKIKKEQQIEELTNASKGIKQDSETNIKVKQAIQDDNKILEAIAALQVLGYNRKSIEKAFEKIENKKELSTEDLIKKGLLLLGKVLKRGSR